MERGLPIGEGGRMWSSAYHFLIEADAQLGEENHTDHAADVLLENV